MHDAGGCDRPVSVPEQVGRTMTDPNVSEDYEAPVAGFRASLTTGPDAEYWAKHLTANAVVTWMVSRLEAVLDLHQCRSRTVDGYTLKWCRECGQDWPCP